MNRAVRLVHVFTVADSLIFVTDQVAAARRLGWDVTVVASPAPHLDEFGVANGVRTVGVDMPRRMSPLGDWQALGDLVELFQDLRPDVVHSHTPKGGLLGTLAANAAGVPVRLYQMRGLPYVTARGGLRTILQTTERLSCAAATRVVCQSGSLRETALADGLASPGKLEVVLRGSNGVDAAGRFSPARFEGRRAEVRTALGLPTDALVIGFVGRLVRDKGVPELVEAFSRLSEREPRAWLLVAGPYEERDPIDIETRTYLETHPRVRLMGFTRDTPGIYAAADVVTLPSHREGFPNVPLEAAAMGLPVVATRIPGCVDAVEDGRTGTLVPVADGKALQGALGRYLEDAELRRTHGRAGREMVERDFRREAVAGAMLALTRRELRRVGYDI